MPVHPADFASGQKSMVPIAFGSRNEKDHNMARNINSRTDVYQDVTNHIIALPEAGTRPWSPSWATGATSLPRRHCGTPYRGVNVLLLWAAAMQRGYANPYWMTYRQASELGAQVRKGERGTMVVHAGTFTPKGRETGEPIHDSDGEEATRSFLKK